MEFHLFIKFPLCFFLSPFSKKYYYQTLKIRHIWHRMTYFTSNEVETLELTSSTSTPWSWFWLLRDVSASVCQKILHQYHCRLGWLNCANEAIKKTEQGVVWSWKKWIQERMKRMEIVTFKRIYVDIWKKIKPNKTKNMLVGSRKMIVVSGFD